MDPISLLGGRGLDSMGFKQLLDTQSLVDCTLACDGGKLSCHKAVLSACSNYLAKILLEHPVEHPIIILPELNIEDVKTLIHYMYTGELLKSSSQHSSSLLRTAAMLSVNSLLDIFNEPINSKPTNDNCGMNDELGVSPNSYNSIINSINNSSLYFGYHDDQSASPAAINATFSALAMSAAAAVAMKQQTSDGQQIYPPDPASDHNNNDGGSAIPSPLAMNGKSQSGDLQQGILSQHQSILNGMTISSNGGSKTDFQFKCPVCHNDFQTICSFEYHMQRVHNVSSFGCEICHKPFASLRYVLTDHMRRCHGWKSLSSNN